MQEHVTNWHTRCWNIILRGPRTWCTKIHWENDFFNFFRTGTFSIMAVRVPREEGSAIVIGPNTISGNNFNTISFISRRPVGNYETKRDAGAHLLFEDKNNWPGDQVSSPKCFAIDLSVLMINSTLFGYDRFPYMVDSPAFSTMNVHVVGFGGWWKTHQVSNPQPRAQFPWNPSGFVLLVSVLKSVLFFCFSSRFSLSVTMTGRCLH